MRFISHVQACLFSCGDERIPPLVNDQSFNSIEIEFSFVMTALAAVFIDTPSDEIIRRRKAIQWINAMWGRPLYIPKEYTILHFAERNEEKHNT